MELIEKYFPEIDPGKKEQIAALGALYGEWNEKINVISRKDIDHLYEHHILHSLVLAKYNPFLKVQTVLDVGTGGGFPGIPLAIMFPDIHFTLLDATGKKIKVVDEIAKFLHLENVIGIHARVEDHKGSYDIIVSRALSSLTQMAAWTKHLVPSKHWIVLKGGNKHDIRKELIPIFKISFTQVSEYFDEEYFKEKWIVDIHKPK